MKEYTVAEVSGLLNVNEETVRRWIRSGELKSTQISRKSGNVINESALCEFVESKPKYRQLMTISSNRSDDVYREGLEKLLCDLITERELLDKQIDKIKNLLRES